jgi:hypothetical protein
MYQKPGFMEVPSGVTHLAWAKLLYNPDSQTLWESNIKDFFVSMSKNLNRKLQFLQIEDVLCAATDRSPAKGDEQLAFAHLCSRWLFSLGVPGVREYPAVITYRRTPFVDFDECIDRMISKHVVFPTWEDIGNKDARLEEIVPVFVAFIRHLVSLDSLRSVYAARLRTKVSDIGYKLVREARFANQFEKSFFVRFANPTLPQSATKYGDSGKPSVVSETSDPKVHETFAHLQTCVEAGPVTRFGLMVSNKVPQELFAFFGPYVPTLSYSYGFPVSVGPFHRFIVDETDVVPWSLEEQEDAYRVTSSQFVPRVSSVLSVAQPYLIDSARRGSMRNLGESIWKIGLDAPEVAVRMADGYRSKTHQWVGSWFSPTRGREVSSERGANGSVLMQDLAQERDRLGEGQVGIQTVVPAWPLLDVSAIDRDPSMKDKIVAKQDFNEEILTVDTATASLVRKTVPMSRFYVQRGHAAIRPAFAEYVVAHRNALRIPEPAAESYIHSALNLSRAQQRRSESAIRLSHRWWVLKRLFGIEVMPYDSLADMIRLEAGLLS